MLEKWLEDNKFRYSEEGFVNIIIKIENIGRFLLLEQDKVFDEEFKLIVQKEIEEEFDYYLYRFGNKFYYTEKGSENKPKLNLFKYVGLCKQELDEDIPYLAIHSGYEILNGSRLYSDWIKKAKFYNYTTLGICERNTLAGALAFQIECKKNKIKFIIGEEITIRRNDVRFDAKVYVINDEGWNNLLTIHKAIKIDNEEFVDEELLLKNGKGLIFIFNPDCLINSKLIEIYKKAFDAIFYQIDTVEWIDQERDLLYLKSIQNYLQNYYKKVPPVLINDSYYLDKEDAYIKGILNTISGKNAQYKSNNQYFKNLDDNYLVFDRLFEDKDKFNQLIFDCLDNLNWIKEKCVFEINTKELYLPKFEMEGIKDNDEFFWKLILDGVEKKLNSKFNYDIPDEYIQRIEMEVEIIRKGNFIDYFLILWDIIEWCHQNNILVGFGRGSVSGSLISYLLNITKVDPIEYNLLFERFLNPGRITGSFPDIDVDFMQNRREEVKEYIKNKYGVDYFCSVGTYTTFQIKSGIQELGRIKGLDSSTRNFITTKIEIGEGEDSDWSKIFDNTVNAKYKKVIKDFIIKNTELIEDLQLCLAQPKNASIHASANVIVPKSKDIFHWMPLKKEGDMLISEWEGEYIEKAGFLKEDLLGLLQLDKFMFMIDLIKKHYNIDIDIYNIPLNDDKVYEMFTNGYTADTFQFGTLGFTDYSKLVKPIHIEDLIAMVALFRPGVMGTGSHIDYVNLKEGRKEPEYDYLCEDITKNTYGVIIYQEQLMQICQRVAGFTLTETDDIRKATGKKIQSLLDSYKPKFIEGAVKNGYIEDDAKSLWRKLETFGSYSFNRSHSVTYAITGYISMWFKVNYPLEFWTTALEFVSKNEYVSRFICEMNKINDASIVPPDINHSNRHFVTDSKSKKIYWSLIQIKEVGEVATEIIIKEREEKGNFYSLEEFIKRVPKNKVNKKVIEALIFVGAFDEIENIKLPQQREGLFKKYYEIAKVKIKDDEKNILLGKDIEKKYWWILKQKEISGLGYLDYYGIIKEYSIFRNKIDQYIDVIDFFFEINGILENKMIAGILVEIREKESKKGMFAEIILNVNDEKIICTLWNESWIELGEKLKNSVGKILIIIGKVVYDSYKKLNVLQSDTYTKIDILD